MSLDLKEVKWRQPVSLIGAVTTALLAFVGTGNPLMGQITIGWGLIFRDMPPAEDALKQIEFLANNGSKLTGLAVLGGIALIGLSITLLYLDNSVRSRLPKTPRLARFCLAAGPAVMAVAQVAFWIFAAKKFSSFTGTTDKDAEELLKDRDLTLALLFYFSGGIATGFGLVIVSIYAMRAGLLTRFMGYLGAIAGVLIVVPLVPMPVILVLWFGAVSFMISGRWLNGLPPAWESPEAQPWPTLSQLRSSSNEDKEDNG